MANYTPDKDTSKTPEYPMLSYNFGDPYRAEITFREESLKRSRRPGFTLSQNAFQLHSIDMIAFNESVLMSDKEMDMLQEIFVPKEPTKPSYPFTPPEFKDDYEDIDISFKVDLTPEIVEARKAVVHKPEPWSEVVCEDSGPTNLLYERAYKEEITNQPFDDPIKVEYEPLEPTIAIDTLMRPKPRVIGIKSIKASKKEITLPDQPTYGYLLALHQFEEDDTLASSPSMSGELANGSNDFTNSRAVTLHSDEHLNTHQPDEETVISISSDEDDVDSIIHATGKLSVDVEERVQTNITRVKEEVTDTLEDNVTFLSVTLTGYSTDVYHLLRVFLISTWETLMSVQVPPLSQWTSHYHSPLQLSPVVTANWIDLFKNYIWEKGFSNVTDEIAELQANLLCLHGATVTLDIFVNLHFELALNHATKFFRKFDQTLPSDFEELLNSLNRLSNHERRMTHPKIAMLIKHLQQQFETIEIRGLIWICLHRYSTEIASLLYEHLGEAGIDCTVDPIIFRPKKEKLFQVRSTPPIIIAEVMPLDFPASKISLILHYESPSEEWRIANKKYSSVIQKALITCLPCDETDDVEIADPQSPPSQGTCSSGSPTIPRLSPAVQHNVNVISLDEVESMTPKMIANDPGSPCSSLEGVTANPFVTQPSYSCSIIIASRLKGNDDFVEALNSAGDIQIHDYDYSFFKELAKYQPDILLSSEAAILIYEPEREEEFSELRMKLLSTSLKCTKCWVIVLCPDCCSSGKLPHDWHSLNSLAHYHAQRILKSEIDLRCKVIPSLAFNYGQLASIVKDIAMDEAAGDVNLPIGHEIQRLLWAPQLNVISAQLVAQVVSSAEFFSMPLKELLKILMQSLSENICLRVIAFHESSQIGCTQITLNDETDEPSASFGKISKNLESYSSPRLGSSPRNLGQAEHDSVEDLKEMWSTDHQSQ